MRSARRGVALAGAGPMVAGAAMLIWLMGTGIVSAAPADTFGPQDTVSRQDLAVVVYRALDLVDDGIRNGSVAKNYYCGKVEGFADVEGPHTSKISCLGHLGIITGYEDRTFRPGLTLSRQQVAAFIYRMLDLVDDRIRNDSVARTYGCNGGDRFADVVGVHSLAIHCLADIAVIAGYGDGTFRPAATVTRQHSAAFVYRALDLADDRARNDSVECDRSSRFSDVSGTHAGVVNCLADIGLHSREPHPDEIPPQPLEFTSISALNGHVCGVLKDSHEIRCWGSNYEDGRFLFYGQAIPPRAPSNRCRLVVGPRAGSVLTRRSSVGVVTNMVSLPHRGGSSPAFRQVATSPAVSAPTGRSGAGATDMRESPLRWMASSPVFRQVADWYVGFVRAEG